MSTHELMRTHTVRDIVEWAAFYRLEVAESERQAQAAQHQQSIRRGRRR